MEAAIKKPSFRQSSGKANEVNYWIFDYPPEKELEVRERIEYMKNKNQKGTDEYQLVVFDLYDIIIDFLERKNFIDMLSPASCKSILPISTLLIRRALWGLPQKWAFGFPVSLEAVNLTF